MRKVLLPLGKCSPLLSFSKTFPLVVPGPVRLYNRPPESVSTVDMDYYSVRDRARGSGRDTVNDTKGLLRSLGETV